MSLRIIGPVRGDHHHFQPVDLQNSGASVSAVPVMPESFLYRRK